MHKSAKAIVSRDDGITIECLDMTGLVKLLNELTLPFTIDIQYSALASVCCLYLANTLRLSWRYLHVNAFLCMHSSGGSQYGGLDICFVTLLSQFA